MFYDFSVSPELKLKKTDYILRENPRRLDVIQNSRNNSFESMVINICRLALKRAHLKHTGLNRTVFLVRNTQYISIYQNFWVDAGT